MLKKVAIVIGLLIVVLLGVVATRPATYRVERSAEVSAPPSAVYALVNDFHKWDAWSPWAKLDPNMKLTFDGAAAGTGAIYYWTGNKEVGEGRMTITESQPDSRVVIKLEFIKPFPTTSTTTFVFTPSGSSTKVTWVMDGKNDFIGKAFTLFMDMDKMIGKDFEKGLASMKGVAESQATQHASN